MSTGYELTVSELAELLHAASPWHRKQIAAMLKAVIRKKGNGFRYFDESGAEISLSEVHRPSQARKRVEGVLRGKCRFHTQRSVYNLWYYYTM